MEPVLWSFLGASLLHMVEEYAYPGGFTAFVKRFNPRVAAHVTVRMAIVVNGLQLLLCLAAIAVDKQAVPFSISVAALLFINGLIHLTASAITGGYVPGTITGTLLYLPISLYAYHLTICSGLLTRHGVISSAGLGLAYQAVPLGYLALVSLLARP